MKSRGLNPIKEMIEDMGGWPVVKGKSWNSSITWQHVVEKAVEKGFWVGFPFDFAAVPNVLQNASEKILMVILFCENKFYRNFYLVSQNLFDFSKY